MKPIIAPINPGDSGSSVTNLQDGIIVLLGKNVIRALDAPNYPTAEELKKLSEIIRKEKDQALFGEGTRQLVLIFQVQQKLGDNLNGKVEEKTADLLNKFLESFGVFDNGVDYEVSGKVLDIAGQVKSGVVVQAYDRDLRKNQLLGQATTDVEGNYAIHYSTEQFLSGESGDQVAPDLLVRVLASDGNILLESDTRFNANVKELIHFKLDAPQLTEWERITAAVTPLLENQGQNNESLHPWELVATDLDFIVSETAIDRERVRLWLLAFDIGTQLLRAIQKPRIDYIGFRRNLPIVDLSQATEVFTSCYGWFREGKPQQLEALLQTPAPELMDALKKAMSGAIIPKLSDDWLKQLAEFLPGLKIDVILKPAQDGEAGSIGDLLDTIPTPLSTEKKVMVATALINEKENNADFITSLKDAKFDEKEINSVLVTRSLGEVASGHTAMVKELQLLRTNENDSSIQYLASQTPLQWMSLVDKAGAPASFAYDPGGYAIELESKVEAQHPTAVFTARVKDSFIEFNNDSLKQTTNFLAVNPDLELKNHNVWEYLNNGAVMNGEKDKTELAKSLQKIQRVQKIASNWEEAGVLLNKDYHSAFQIVHQGYDGFINSVGDEISAQNAQNIYYKAQEVHDNTLAMIGNYIATISNPSLVTISKDENASASASKNFPQLAQLFGNLDMCECKDCQSVLGPAAYLVDTMHFLDFKETTGIPNPLNVMLGRRPDIADLELTCANTNTEVPYIDLILEILENAVALPLLIDPPYGFNPEVDFTTGTLTDTVDEAVRKVLLRTSIIANKNLRVRVSERDPRDWVVSDGSRGWILRYLPNSISKSPSQNSLGSSLSVADIQQAVGQLGRGQLPSTDWIIPPGNAKDKYLPLVGNPEVIEVVTGTKWKVVFERSVLVEIVMANPVGAIKFTSVDGQKIDSLQLQGSVVQLIATSLANNVVRNALLQYLPSQFGYDVSRQNQTTFKITAKEKFTKYYFTYSPEKLWITAMTYQSTGPNEDLKASPENRNPEAYKILDSAAFPWSLPFDLWLEEVRTFLENSNFSRQELMEECDPGDRLYEGAIGEPIAMEVLGLSKAEKDIIAPGTIQQPWTYWNLQETNNSIKEPNTGVTIQGDWIQVLSLVSVLLNRSGLNYRELLNVLQSRFVSKIAPALMPAGDECNTSKQALPGLKADHLIRIHRFVRLQRKLNWTCYDLDLALAAVSDPNMDLDVTVLRKLSYFQRLHQLLNLPVSTLASWWGELITEKFYDNTKSDQPVLKSIYERLFLNPTIQNPPDPDFEPDNISTSSKTLLDKSALISASLGIQSSELTQLLNAGATGGQTNLSVRNLACIYRNVLLARKLGLSIQDYTLALGVTNIDPFLNFKSPVAFVETVQFNKRNRYKFSWKEMDYLLRYKSNAPENSLFSYTWIEQVLTDLRTSIQTVQKDMLNAAEPVADRLRKTLTQLGWYPSLIQDATDLLDSEDIFEADIAGSQTPVVNIPTALKVWITYDAIQRKISLNGDLEQSEWNDFLTANTNDTNTVNAINDLQSKVANFIAGLVPVAHRLQSFSLPIFTVDYTNAIAPVIPPALASRCFYNKSANTVTYIGWVTPIEEQQLNNVFSPDILHDANGIKTKSDQYQENVALNQFLSISQVNSLFKRGQTVASRYDFVISLLLPSIYRSTLVEKMSMALNLEPDVIRELVESQLNQSTTMNMLLDATFINSDFRIPIAIDDFTNQVQALGKLHKAGMICGKLNIATTEFSWLPTPAQQGGNAKTFDVLELDKLPIKPTDAIADYSSLEQLIHLFELRDNSNIGSDLVSTILQRINANDKNSLMQDLVETFDIVRQDVYESAENQLHLKWHDDTSTPVVKGDYVVPSSLLNLATLLQTVKRFGVDAVSLFSLCKDNLSIDDAALARKLFRAQFTEDNWLEQLKPITDSLREKQRDALVNYLIQRDKLNTPAELYDRYLVDVEMGSCKSSTRILHAISAVQLFTQRSLMNLEPEVSPGTIDKDRWRWMKNYRVWEANRKVFLYPENWIEPELRDDKTDIFKELESQLMQDELTNDRAEELVKGYLKNLEDIAHLNIVGMYIQNLVNEDGSLSGDKTIHIVGRTINRPSHFFYRQWIITSMQNRWTSWEKLPIDGVKTDHILPFVLRGEVYVAWPEFTQLPTTTDDTGTVPPKWKLQMAWVRQTANGWADRLMSANSLEHPWVPGKDENNLFTFKVRTEQIDSSGNSSVSIDCIGGIEKKDNTFTFSTGDQQTNFGLNTIDKFDHIPKSDPWMIIYFTGRVAASYTVGGNQLYDYISGAFIKVNLILSSSAAKSNYDNESFWQGYSWPDHSPTEIDNASQNHVEASGYSDSSGYFFISFAPVARAMYHPDVLSDAKFRLKVVSIPGDNTAASPNPKEFIFKDAVGSTIYTDITFSQNFEQVRTSPYPGGNPNRELEMHRIAQFVLEDADDASFQDRTSIIWTPPAKMQINASRYVAPDTSNSVLVLPDSTVNVWSGLPTPFSLLPGFPVDINTEDSQNIQYGPPQVMVFSDANNSYFIRNENSGSFNFEIEVDGHPRAHDLRKEIYQRGVTGLFDLKQQSWVSVNGFDGHTAGNNTDLQESVTTPAIRFSPADAQTPYASYNTELFFQVPFLIASYLSDNQRFADAQQWFHFIFNPTTDEATNDIKRYWKYLPFRSQTNAKPVDELLKLLSEPGVSSSDADAKAIRAQIDSWLENPFMPHAVARLRPRSYMFSVVFKYLDNLIAWGDQLFRQSTTESINEATQLYILVSKILGPRPQNIPKRYQAAPLTYRRASNWDEFSNTWVEVEANLYSATNGNYPIQQQYNQYQMAKTGALSSIGMLYFSIPSNDKLTTYWDTIEDRLFNIRHCRNIEGIDQQVALFQPPIDPALLVRAAAAGLDISSILADSNAPLPYYRFNVMTQKASELCGELKSLGNQLLSILEKKDAEQLSLLRSTQEIDMLRHVRDIKLQQIEEAKTNLEALHKTEKSATIRFLQYEKLLGNSSATVPDDEFAEVEQSSVVKVTGSNTPEEFTGLGMIQAEFNQIGNAEDAMRFGVTAGIFSTISGICYAIPSSTQGTPFFGVTFGGLNLGSVMSAGSSFFGALEKNSQHQANRSATIGNYQRRQDEWVHQCKLALSDLQQIRKQIAAAEIRQAIAENELTNHDVQAQNAQDIDQFMRTKYTNKDLYQWMIGQVSGIYFQTYKLAIDVAKKAERAYRHELGLQDSSFVNYGYWDNLKKGLLSGERLFADLKRMEVSYLDQHRREFEITKNISLKLLNPNALIALKETGKCEIEFMENFFDADYPGHYMRRIKSMSFTMPCIAGPYTSINCTLTLLSSKTRISNTDKGTYSDDMDSESPRVVTNYLATQSIALSSGQNDAGMFELNFHDERYLPFEGAGAVSRWRIELPKDSNAFDFTTIADVIFRMAYTSRDGGSSLRSAARKAKTDLIADVGNSPLARMFSLKHEFADQWYKFLYPAADENNQQIDLNVAPDHFPFLFRGKSIQVNRAELFLKFKDIKDDQLFTHSTPIGDYQAGSTLNIGLTLPDASTKNGNLTSSSNYINGVPYLDVNNLTIEVKGPGKWQLQATETGINAIAGSLKKTQGTHTRLKPEVIDDLVIIFHYTVAD